MTRQATHYDAIVIGAGQSGGPLSTAMAGHGWRTALVERSHVGGTCINDGCTPTKTMIASARVAHVARRAGDYGVSTGQVSVDMPAVRRRKRDMIEAFREGSRSAIEAADGVDLIYGEASFSANRTIEVALCDGGRQTLTAERFFINTGTRNSTPPIDGLEHAPFLDSTSIMELDEVPEHLVVIGGGYVGLEFGQMFRRFGSEVTIIQRSGRLLSREDDDISSAVCEILEEDGIDVRLNTTPERVVSDGTCSVRVIAGSGERTIAIDGSHLLVAVGRTPNSDRLNLAAAGVETDERGFIAVNERLETSAPGIWAMGEIAGQPAFTHISYDDFRVIRANLLDGGERTISDRLLSYVVYIDPQLGRVGLNERQARDAGHEVRIASMPMTGVARANETGETRGLMKAVVDAESDHILGAAVLGIEGGEIMSIIQTAMLGNLPYQVLRDATFAHPTLAESLNNLFNSLD